MVDGRLSPEVEDAFRRMISTQEFSANNIKDLRDYTEKFIRENFLGSAEVIQEFQDSFDPDAGLANNLQRFIEFFENAEIDEDLENILRNFVQPGFNYLSTLDDPVGLINLLQDLGYSTQEEIQSLGAIFGDDLESVLSQIQADTERFATDPNLGVS
jgi:hypothetical protein